MTEYEIRQNRLLSAAEFELSETKARLAEAVELLETFRNYECTCADLGRGFKCDICQVRTFLDKVKR